MAITRINHFEAKPSLEDRLHEFLGSVSKIVLQCPGCLSVRLLRDTEHQAQFAIIEEWESIEAHRSAASAISPELMAEAMALFARPPSGAYFRD